MDTPNCSALSLLHEVARRAGRIDEVMTRSEPFSNQTRTDRGEPNQMSFKPVERIVTSQEHQIQSFPLRSSADDFFGVGATADSAEQGLTSPITITTTISPKARSQLLHFLDPLVLMFNVADFDALAASLVATCSKNVVVHTKLVADGVAAQNPSVTSFCPGNLVPEYLRASGVSAVLLFWMLLHEAHPDGVMQIIDKRICYRTVLPDRILTPRAITSAASRLSLAEKTNNSTAKTCASSQACTLLPAGAGNCDSKKNAASESSSSSCCSSGPTITEIGNNNINKAATSNRDSPVSIVEIVLKLSGACITTYSLHDLFCDLSSDTVPPLVALPAKEGSKEGGAESDDPQKFSFDTEAFSRYISTCLTKECCSAACMAVRGIGGMCPAAKKSKFDPDVLKVAETAASLSSSAASRPADFLHEHSRRYLLELRVVFDQYDVITDWTATVLAAESF